jgi:L-fuconolactonase
MGDAPMNDEAVPVTARVDAHHHLWDLTARPQPWLDGAEMEPLRRSFRLNEVVAQASAAGIDATVVVQTVPDLAETEELLDLAAAEPAVIGVVGYVALSAPDVGDQLDRLLDRTSGGWLIGVRSLVQAEPDPAWLMRPEVLSGLREVARRHLVFDLLVRPPQLATAVGAVTEVSEGRFVLDHLGKPEIAAGRWEPWAAALSELAARDNVVAKLSGLVTEARWDAWTRASLEPYVDHALSAFGPDRLMFGSDWPVCTLAASYGQVVSVVEKLTTALSPHERSAIFGATAVATYGLTAVADGDATVPGWGR